MNPCLVYVPKGTSHTAEQLRDMWHSGEVFRIWRHAIDVTVHSSLKLRMAGFTHVRIVYTHPDNPNEPLAHDEELK